MTDRSQVEHLLRELHTARLEADLEHLCRLFASDARLRIAGTSDGKPIAISASRIAQIRSRLSMLVKTFRLSQYQLLSLTVDGARAAGHWRVDVHSKITGTVASTELLDLIEVRDGQIASYIEFFVAC
jgi:ketosteroid isomerase-like protein